jgi:hypothetical protein
MEKSFSSSIRFDGHSDQSLLGIGSSLLAAGSLMTYLSPRNKEQPDD